MINRLMEYLPGQEARSSGGGTSGATGQGKELSLAKAKEWIEPAEEMIRKYPAACLASAFVIGVAIAWWIKRT